VSISPDDESTDPVDDSLPAAMVHKTWIQVILFFPAAIAILIVRSYQLLLSPLLGRTCRFHPSCSQYFILAVRRHGLCLGGWRGLCRILRCHPWNPGGYDPP